MVTLIFILTILLFACCRIKDPASQRSVSIGIGFRERETAFDFKSSLNEYVRYVDRMSTANKMSKEQADLIGEDDQVAKHIFVSSI